MNRAAGGCAIGLMLAMLSGCPAVPPGGVDTLVFDFSDGAQGWVADVSDYSEAEAAIIDFEAELRDLPAEIDPDGRGFFVASSNRSDDLFVFLKKQVGPAEGFQPDTEYTLRFTVTLASNAPSGCFGAGGATGEGVYVKAGGSGVEPEPLEPDENGYIALSVDKGVQSSGGPAASVIGDIANGEECDDPENAPYVTIERRGEHTVATDPDGHLWLLVGTDSAFEGITTLYYQRIEIEVEEAP